MIWGDYIRARCEAKFPECKPLKYEEIIQILMKTKGVTREKATSFILSDVTPEEAGRLEAWDEEKEKSGSPEEKESVTA